jgi:two-component system sensor histidine kinase HydH
MTRRKKSTFQRRFLIASAVFGLFVLANFALFGWLIYRAMSEQEIRRVLLEAEDDAKDLAQQIAARSKRQGDLFTAVASMRETQTYIDSVLAKRETIEEINIFNQQHVLVYNRKNTSSSGSEASAAPTVGSPEVAPQRVEHRTEQFESPPITVAAPRLVGDDLQIKPVVVPIPQLGTIEIGISPVRLNRQITVLRSTLIQKAAITGFASFALLLTSFVFVWLLLRRSQRLEAQAAEAERMAYVGTLASGLAHEIRSPLNSLSLNMQMLEEEMSEGPASSFSSGRRLLNITRSELARLERLATDFLTYAKPRSLELQEVPAVRLFERLRDVLAGEIHQRGVQLVVKDRSNGARVKVDSEQFNQLLLNLAQNAIAATEESGRQPSLFLTVVRQGEKVTLEIVDNGVGMAEDEQKKIFDLFYSNRKGGTGLGLAIVDRIARAHGAELSLRSAPGVGTAVSVALPLAGSANTSSRNLPLPKIAAS